MSAAGNQSLVYRCGPQPSHGCGQEFAFDMSEAPRECPLCGAIFCGADCCGNEAEFVREGAVVVEMLPMKEEADGDR